MGVRLPESSLKHEGDLYITLKPPNNNVHTQMVLASIRKKDFELVVKPRYQCSADDGRSNKVPVSYTHLDVYKRQAMGSCQFAWPKLNIRYPTILI